MRAALPLTVLALAIAHPTLATDRPIVARKLVLTDKSVRSGKASALFVAKDPAITKGAGTDPAGIAAVLYVVLNGERAVFAMPAGDRWRANTAKAAKYRNPDAPSGGSVKASVVKNGKALRVAAKSLGDTPLDIATPPDGPVSAAYVLVNGGDEERHCTQFASCAHRLVAGGTGSKVTCKGASTGDPGCLAVPPFDTTTTSAPPSTSTSSTTSSTTSTTASTSTSTTSSSTTSSSATSSTSTSTSTSTSVSVVPTTSTTTSSSTSTSTTSSTSSSSTTTTSTSTSSTTTTSMPCFFDNGATVLDVCRNREWEKKDGLQGLPGSGDPDAANPHDVDNRYSWAGSCLGDAAILCQPTPAAAFTCDAQTGGHFGCALCPGATGPCVVDPFSEGALTTVWEWVANLNMIAFAGHSDWRIPTVAREGEPAELETIFAPWHGECAGGMGACIDPVFGPTPSFFYVSSVSDYASEPVVPASAWLASFFNGTLAVGPKPGGHLVRAVRSTP